MPVDLSDLSHSYPFLHLSRKLAVPYEEILSIADRVDKIIERDGKIWPGFYPDDDHYNFERFDLVVRICSAPWRWDMSRAGDRGL